jgi:hypothetical protein
MDKVRVVVSMSMDMRKEELLEMLACAKAHETDEVANFVNVLSWMYDHITWMNEDSDVDPIAFDVIED